MNLKLIPILFGFLLITACSYFNISEKEMVKRSQNAPCWKNCDEKKYHQKPNKEKEFLLNRKMD